MNIKKLIITLVVLLSFQDSIFSQAQLGGRVIDSVGNKSVEFAMVSIFKAKDTIPLNGQLTDTTGVFLFDNIKEGNYYLRIEVLGYEPKVIKNITLGTKQKNLGAVKINHSLQTEVVIIGQQENVSNKLDKQVYKAAQFESAKGGAAIDVLKNMPSVTVSADGEIRLRGSTGFLVLINGKAVLTDVNTVLSQIPANAVENIEIITAPSSKYDADGKSGIINITTKKGVTDGLSFTVNTQYGLPSVDYFNNKNKPNRYGADGYVNYKKNKWDVTVGGSYQENDIAGRRVGNANTTINNLFTSFPSAGERSFQRRNYSARMAATYTPNKKNSISIGAYLGQRRQFRRADIDYNNTTTDLTSGQITDQIAYFNSNLVKKQGDFKLINLDYTRTFSNKSTLTFSGIYEHALLSGYTKNLNANLNNHSDTLDYVLNTNNSPLDGVRIKVDYATTIGKGKFEAGGQFRYQNQTGSFLYENAILGTGQYSIVPEFSANIRIVNNIKALYSQYSGKIGKLEYLTGLRYEYSKRSFNASQLTQPYELNLSNFFPSVNLLYSLNDKLKSKMGVSRRVQRSTSNELNPYPEREHSETLEQGDPRILPEFVYLAELGLIRDINKNGSVFLTFYYQQINNVVNRVNSVYNDTILNRIYTNVGIAKQWGIETGTNLKPVKWWTIYLGTNLYDYRINGSLFNNTVVVNNSGITYSINTNQTFQLVKTLSIVFNLNYTSQRPTAQGFDSRFISPNLSIKKTFFAGKLSATLQWQNMSLGLIKSNEQSISTSGSNFYTTTNYIQEKDVFWINLSYNFKQTNKKVKLPTSEFGEKEF